MRELLKLGDTDVNMVFAKNTKDVPFTTSKIISECAGVDHPSIRRLIEKYKDRLDRYGVSGFEIQKPKAGSSGGRPEKVYHLNELQATLIITFLRNTEQVIDFKEELVRQFFAMRHKLEMVQSAQNDFKELTACIASIHRSETQWYHFKNECDMINQLVTGLTSKQFRTAHDIEKCQSIRPYLSAAEIYLLERLQNADIVYLTEGFDFQTRREKLAVYRDKLVAGQYAAAVKGD